jgi:hypothetical protein
MRRLGRAAGFPRIPCGNGTEGNMRSRSKNRDIDHTGNHHGFQDFGEEEALVSVEGIDLLCDSVSGALGHPGTHATGISPPEFLRPDRHQSVGRVSVPTLHHPGGRASPRTSWPYTVTPWIRFSAREAGPERSRRESSGERSGYLPAMVRNDWCMRTHRSPTRRQVPFLPLHRPRIRPHRAERARGTRPRRRIPPGEGPDGGRVSGPDDLRDAVFPEGAHRGTGRPYPRLHRVRARGG